MQRYVVFVGIHITLEFQSLSGSESGGSEDDHPTDDDVENEDSDEEDEAEEESEDDEDEEESSGSGFDGSLWDDFDNRGEITDEAAVSIFVGMLSNGCFTGSNDSANIPKRIVMYIQEAAQESHSYFQTAFTGPKD